MAKLALTFACDSYAHTRALRDETVRPQGWLFGADPWPYGLEPNRKTPAAFLRYHHEPGLSRRLFAPEELFAPETLSEYSPTPPH